MGAISGVLVVLHVITAVVGFGAVVATGAFAMVAGRDPGAPAVTRYFRPGTNWAAHSLLLVPAFGAALEWSNGWPDVHLAWPWIALAIWAAAAAAGFGVHWPSERDVQRLVATRRDGGEPAALAGACRRAAWSSAFMTAAFAAALVVMLVQPH